VGALRGAFGGAMRGKPVAGVGPTPLLARQHYKTFTERFQGWPVKIRRLSRLVPAAEANQTREGLKNGVPAKTIDVIKHRKSLRGVVEADAVVIQLGREMFRAKKVSSATYARALKQFGPRNLINLVGLMGNYAGTAVLLATFDMQLPAGQKPLLPMP
jgi:hypothetical protein